ncbi:hypothetical protein GJW-30_1_03450 [Variibacter gotjawalensis]|uniref:Nuclear transport factor 2 family protein n=1 Tax=Variibacter gotjawalensis TaxID=1333996 RepID=A0A0S3PYE1_9BRAD|nr:hypothetical protein [Variibacter gotjawalensis]NIK46736.1 hypothetical protein [Variibacter gotjawalensis]RZS48640.1 hypothetical protein EV661_1055 [Variibacter gotjawalensis]BAT60900.1 hypothetical protein GJW-30_1_03450 [Variibacter gotjawalensis]
MKLLSKLLIAVALLIVAPALAQAPKKAVASAELRKEFDAFLVKFRAALKANDVGAVVALTKLPFMEDATTGDEAKFRAKIYPDNFSKKTRACIASKKAVYSRDQLGKDNFFIFCGESIFVFTKTPQGFLFTEIGAND